MYKYLGGGFIVGIPARDLTDEEARPYLKKSGFQKLYKKIGIDLDLAHDKKIPKDFDVQHNRKIPKDFDPEHDARNRKA